MSTANDVDTCQTAIELAISALGDAYVEFGLPVSAEVRGTVSWLLASVKREIADLRAIDHDDVTIPVALVLLTYGNLEQRFGGSPLTPA